MYCKRGLQGLWRRDGYSEKSHTIQVFHTAHIVLDRERNSNVTLHYIEAFVLLNTRQLHFPMYSFSYWQSRERTLSVTTAKWPEHCLVTFLSNISEKSLDLNVEVLLRIVPASHLTIYCCWLHQQGGVVIGVMMLQPQGLGSIPSDSQDPPCWGALQQDMKFLATDWMQFRLTLALHEKMKPFCSFKWDHWGGGELMHKKGKVDVPALLERSCVSQIFLMDLSEDTLTDQRLSFTAQQQQWDSHFSECFQSERKMSKSTLLAPA